jgi:hypothetical protein
MGVGKLNSSGRKDIEEWKKTRQDIVKEKGRKKEICMQMK